MTYKIAYLQKSLRNIGINISIDQIRKLEVAGIVFCEHSKKNKYRYFTDEQLKKSVRNIIHYYFHTPLKIIKEDNIETLKLWANKIIKTAKTLTK